MQEELKISIQILKNDGMSTIKPTDNYYHVETERLKFISLKKEHCALWEPFFVNNPTERFLGFEGSTKSNAEKAEFWINKQIDRENNQEYGQLAIIEKSSGKFVGLAGIIPREINGHEEFEVTYSLLQNHWGKGFATEAARFFKEFILANGIGSSAISIIHIENEASINVAAKNDMAPTLTLEFMEMPVVIYRSI